MRYNFAINDGGYNMMTTSGASMNYQAPKPATAAELKAEAMHALAAWQKVLRAETAETATLDALLADMAAQINDKRESDKLDAAIRAEYLERTSTNTKRPDVIIPPTGG